MRKAKRTAPNLKKDWQKEQSTSFSFSFISKVFNGTAYTPDGVVTDGESSVLELQSVPVRSASIKGSLRFWWRALASVALTKAGTIQNLQDLKNEEKRIWGLTSSPSSVSIAISGEAGSQNVGYTNDESYILFPLQQIQRDNPSVADQLVRQIVGSLTLTLTYTSSLSAVDKKLVEDSVRAWLWFGGYGSRTRRGLGAVAQRDSRDTIQDIINFVAQYGLKKDETGGIPGVPHLTTTFLYKPQRGASEAFRYGWEKMRYFRQGVGIGRNPGEGRRPGRSRWPEADALRRKTRTWVPHHPPIHPIDQKYPRGVFGLPIIFEIREEELNETLKPVGAERMASPLILKPIKLGNQFYSIALLLKEEGNIQMEIKGKGNVKHQLTSAEVQSRNPRASNMHLPDSFSEPEIETDPIKAFLRFYQ